MNKYVILIIIGVVIIAAGVIYKTFIASESSKPVSTGIVKEFTITAKKNSWAFSPDEIDVNRGDKLILTVVNEDDFDHGLGIDAYSISERMPARQTIKVEFTATQPGEFPFYCSVPCGEGLVNGVKRTHFDMVGKIKVKDIIKTTEAPSTDQGHSIEFNVKAEVK